MWRGGIFFALLRVLFLSLNLESHVRTKYNLATRFLKQYIFCFEFCYHGQYFSNFLKNPNSLEKSFSIRPLLSIVRSRSV